MNATHAIGLGLGLLLVAATACYGEDPPDAWALRLALVSEGELGTPSIVTLKTMPPGFDVVFTPEMPSAGWAFEVDALDVDAEAQRITARVTLTPPEGVAAQVVTPTPLRLSLGNVAPGRWFLEIWLREGKGTTHRPVRTLLLDATR